MMLVTGAARKTAMWVVLAAAVHGAVQAQDMRIYTNVYVVEGEKGTGRPVSHSLTLFHAGNVYDYMVDVEEVVILEPVQHRFVILGPDYTATEVPFAQVLQFLQSANETAEQMIAELNQQGDEASRRRAATLQFQLNPLFEVASERPHRLALRSQFFSYEVSTANVDSRQVLEQYLAYADWAARMNFVLHPQALLPAARLALNEELRQRNELPVKVTLTRHSEGVLKLRAEHQFSWQLQSADKLSISQWEKRLASDRVRWVSFHEYQQSLLARRGR